MNEFEVISGPDGAVPAEIFNRGMMLRFFTGGMVLIGDVRICIIGLQRVCQIGFFNGMKMTIDTLTITEQRSGKCIEKAYMKNTHTTDGTDSLSAGRLIISRFGCRKKLQTNIWIRKKYTFQMIYIFFFFFFF